MQEIRAQEEREQAESLGCEPGQRPGGGGVRVSTNMAAPANMLTDREMECITTVFRCVISQYPGSHSTPTMFCRPTPSAKFLLWNGKTSTSVTFIKIVNGFVEFIP